MSKPQHLLGFTILKGYHDSAQQISKIYRHKIITYGRYKQVHDYFQVRVSFSSKRTLKKRSLPKPKSDYALQRAKQRVFQIIEANHQRHGTFRTIFATLTFKNQTADRKEADSRVRNYIRRLERYVGHKMKYILVPERHLSGNIHYHGVFFNLPYIPVQLHQNKIYKEGYLDLQQPKKLKNITHYISKYITKDVISTVKPKEHTYLIPRNMIIPTTEFDFFEPTDNLKVLEERYLPHKKITKYGYEV